MTTEVNQHLVEAVVQVLMSNRYVIGLDELNSDNMDEWLFRMVFARVLDRDAFKMRLHFGNPLEPWPQFYISRDHLNYCIGLKLNVKNMSRTVWIKDLMKAVDRRIGMDGGSFRDIE